MMSSSLKIIAQFFNFLIKLASYGDLGKHDLMGVLTPLSRLCQCTNHKTGDFGQNGPFHSPLCSCKSHTSVEQLVK
jgi:hypothetical protein